MKGFLPIIYCSPVHLTATSCEWSQVVSPTAASPLGQSCSAASEPLQRSDSRKTGMGGSGNTLESISAPGEEEGKVAYVKLKIAITYVTIVRHFDVRFQEGATELKFASFCSS